MSALFDASREHYPMSGLDEFMIHNHPHPVRVMWTSDLQAYERMWFTCQDRTGDLLVVTGMGIYPNLGTAEAFAIVNVRGRHTTVRAHRKLGLNRMDMSAGPLRFDLVEPFREWRIRLDENPFGVGFDLSWTDTKRPGVPAARRGNVRRYPAVRRCGRLRRVRSTVGLGRRLR